VLAGTPLAGLRLLIEPEAYKEAKKLWLDHIITHSKKVSILGNAAVFFIGLDNHLAEFLLERAQILDPDNHIWPLHLGRIYMQDMANQFGELRMNFAKKSLGYFETALSKAPKEVERFWILTNIAKLSFECQQYNKAKAYSDILLSTAQLHKDDWNYGNALHQANIILGKLALRSGDLQEAGSYLIKAGKTPGSPQLDTKGPDMTLAKELLENGETEVVIKYLELCDKFWELGQELLKNWISTIERGGIPDFKRFAN